MFTFNLYHFRKILQWPSPLKQNSLLDIYVFHLSPKYKNPELIQGCSKKFLGKMKLNASFHIRVLVWVPDTPLPIQLHAKTPGKALEVGPSTWALATHVGVGQSSWFLASAWLRPGCCSHLRSESVNGRPVFLSPCLSNKLINLHKN